MRTASIVAAALVFGASTFAMIRNAHALGPLDVEIGAKAGIATRPLGASIPPPPPPYLTVYGPEPPLAAPNPFGFGVGARGGVDFLGFYGGVGMTYYFGGTTNTPSGGSTTLSESSHTLMYGVEAGYGVTLIGVLTIRPQIGIGSATFSANVSQVGGTYASSTSESHLYLEPGVTVLASLGRWFVGADADLVLFPSATVLLGHDPRTSFSPHGQVGLKF
jgi:hypothetical protein